MYKFNGRFNSNKSFLKDTSLNTSTVEGSGHFMSEKEKYDRNTLNENIGETDKIKKNLSTLSRLSNFYQQNELLKERVDVQTFLKDQQKMVSLNERSKKLRIYEMVYWIYIRKIIKEIAFSNNFLILLYQTYLIG